MVPFVAREVPVEPRPAGDIVSGVLPPVLAMTHGFSMTLHFLDSRLGCLLAGVLITWGLVPDAVSYAIYRTAAGGTASTTGLSGNSGVVSSFTDTA